MTSLPPPGERGPGFKHDPATDGRYLRWWSGTAWGDATRPVGGPTLADVAAGSLAAPDPDRSGLAPITRRTLWALLVGLMLVFFGVRMLAVDAQAVVGTSQLLTGWVVVAAGALVAQAGLVGIVVAGFAYTPNVAPAPEPQPTD